MLEGRATATLAIATAATTMLRGGRAPRIDEDTCDFLRLFSDLAGAAASEVAVAVAVVAQMVSSVPARRQPGSRGPVRVVPGWNTSRCNDRS
jgi:hypothetical protein